MSKNLHHDKIRAHFPILTSKVYDTPLVYLDNAATTQKPQSVIDAISHYYAYDNANIHRGVHTLSMRATNLYENARDRLRQFLGAPSSYDVVFCRGTTEAINLVAHSYVKSSLQPGDTIVVTAMEHHANIVPWQIIAEETGASVVAVNITDDGLVDLDDYQVQLAKRPRLVALSHVSNALGTIHPIEKMVQMAKEQDLHVLIDGAQAAPHLPIDLGAISSDFYAFSGHKMYGPTGVGVLCAKRTLLDQMLPYQGGGDMIETVSFDQGSTYQQGVQRFEAGTPHIAGVIGLVAAVDFLESQGMSAISEHEHHLYEYARERMEALPFIRMFGDQKHNCGILSFTLEGIHAHDVGTILDNQGIAVRAGHHCAMPVMTRYQVPATVRASLGLYNTPDEIDKLIQGLHSCRDILGV